MDLTETEIKKIESLKLTNLEIENLRTVVIINQEPKIFEIGRIVIIIDGPFSNMKGIINAINDNNIEVSVMMFGKETKIILEKKSLEIIDKEF
jgi:transcription antitermination factor NusG